MMHKNDFAKGELEGNEQINKYNFIKSDVNEMDGLKVLQ